MLLAEQPRLTLQLAGQQAAFLVTFAADLAIQKHGYGRHMRFEQGHRLGEVALLSQQGAGRTGHAADQRIAAGRPHPFQVAAAFEKCAPAVRAGGLPRRPDGPLQPRHLIGQPQGKFAGQGLQGVFHLLQQRAVQRRIPQLGLQIIGYL
ncbi:hypothetical protein ATDW_05280 [Asticcacaulis sp. DW145]|uniref:hypothetical protein n=1 Tax=Asticcacaulis sp. DW145 TaxID=3095608 RepID=UPI003089ED4B|nr:hypothetical protein ATDW_05280 [Asticcacaulis sp. DW145]